MSLRIRTIARLTGIREATLRAWERRHGFPRPSRTLNNYRLYSQEEVENVRRVAQLIATGLSVSEAIESVRATPAAALPRIEGLTERFWSSIAVMDATRAGAVLDEAAGAMEPSVYCNDFLLPLLREMSTRLDIAREHLASGLIRQRLWHLLQTTEGHGPGGSFLLACPPREQHEGGLLALAFELKRRGHQVVVLGADTPPEALASACRQLHPDAVALSLVGRREASDVAEAVSRAVEAAAPVPVIVGGPAAREHLRAVFRSGAQYAETADELEALWRQLREPAAQRLP